MRYLRKNKFQFILFLLIGLISIGLGVLSQQPEFALKIPRVGFLVYGLLRHFPPFLDRSMMKRCVDKEKCPWLESGDVVVNCCTKCGTNWIMTVVHELRLLKTPNVEDFRDILEVSPWIGLMDNPGQTAANVHEGWGELWNKTNYPFKMFKGHFSPYYKNIFGVKSMNVPVKERSDIKYIVMVRNPEDVVSSLSKFFASHNPDYYSFWGVPMPPSGILTSLLLYSTIGATSSPVFFSEKWFNFAEEENVLFLHYTNVFKNQKKYIKKIAAFVGIDITEKDVEIVLQKTSIDYMKKRNNRYRHFSGYNKQLPLILPPEKLAGGGLVSDSGFGSGRKKLTDLEKWLMKRHARSYLNAEQIEKLYNGFE